VGLIKRVYTLQTPLSSGAGWSRDRPTDLPGAGMWVTSHDLSGARSGPSSHHSASPVTTQRSSPTPEEGKDDMAEPSLYERLGGVFAIAAVVDHFSDALVKNPIVGQGSKNPELREWHTDKLDRLPGLKFMRTLWVCNVAGGPLSFTATKPGSTPLGLEEAHREFQITPEEFDEVVAELGRSLDHFGVPPREKEEVVAAFAAHKREVTEGSMASA
jgi:hemoglobin